MSSPHDSLGKADAAHKEHVDAERGPSSPAIPVGAAPGVRAAVGDADVDVDTSGINEKKLLRRIDLRLIPWLSFLYLLSFLDRTSIGNAKVRFACHFNSVGDMDS
jgi:hypothetical protein